MKLWWSLAALPILAMAAPTAAQPSKSTSKCVLYQGAVQVCRAEINDPAICPDDFPTYPTCELGGKEAPTTCEIAVVGAGAGGLYTALRYVHDSTIIAVLLIG